MIIPIITRGFHKYKLAAKGYRSKGGIILPPSPIITFDKGPDAILGNAVVVPGETKIIAYSGDSGRTQQLSGIGEVDTTLGGTNPFAWYQGQGDLGTGTFSLKWRWELVDIGSSGQEHIGMGITNSARTVGFDWTSGSDTANIDLSVGRDGANPKGTIRFGFRTGTTRNIASIFSNIFTVGTAVNCSLINDGVDINYEFDIDDELGDAGHPFQGSVSVASINFSATRFPFFGNVLDFVNWTKKTRHDNVEGWVA